MRRLNKNTAPWVIGPWRLAVVFVICGGCQPLPPGRLEAVSPAAPPSCRGNAYLIRGWRDLWSQGIDQLAERLRHNRVNATAFRAEQWRDLAAAICRQYTAGGAHDPLVLIGFSYGADDVLRIAQELEQDKISVDLAVTIDPVTPPPVPANVRRCYNLYQTNGIWDLFPWLRGIPLRQQSPGRGELVNVDIRGTRPDLLEPNTSHATIAANPKIHQEAIRQVLSVLPRR